MIYDYELLAFDAFRCGGKEIRQSDVETFDDVLLLLSGTLLIVV